MRYGVRLAGFLLAASLLFASTSAAAAPEGPSPGMRPLLLWRLGQGLADSLRPDKPDDPGSGGMRWVLVLALQAKDLGLELGAAPATTDSEKDTNARVVRVFEEVATQFQAARRLYGPKDASTLMAGFHVAFLAFMYGMDSGEGRQKLVDELKGWLGAAGFAEALWAETIAALDQGVTPYDAYARLKDLVPALERDLVAREAEANAPLFCRTAASLWDLVLRCGVWASAMADGALPADVAAKRKSAADAAGRLGLTLSIASITGEDPRQGVLDGLAATAPIFAKAVELKYGLRARALIDFGMVTLLLDVSVTPQRAWMEEQVEALEARGTRAGLPVPAWAPLVAYLRLVASLRSPWDAASGRARVMKLREVVAEHLKGTLRAPECWSLGRTLGYVLMARASGAGGPQAAAAGEAAVRTLAEGLDVVLPRFPSLAGKGKEDTDAALRYLRGAPSEQVEAAVEKEHGSRCAMAFDLALRSLLVSVFYAPGGERSASSADMLERLAMLAGLAPAVWQPAVGAIRGGMPATEVMRLIEAAGNETGRVLLRASSGGSPPAEPARDRAPR
jgi:hypothetical protein